MSLHSFYTEISRHFGQNLTSAFEVYLTIKNAPRAVRTMELVQLFPAIHEDKLGYILSVLSNYPEENFRVKEIAAAKICTTYVSDRWKVFKSDTILPPSVITTEIVDRMYRPHKNQRYRYVSDSQIISTALYFIHQNQASLSRLIVRESEQFSPFPDMVELLKPLISDLDFVRLNPPRPIERKSSNM